MMNRKVLIASYYWPPSGGSGVQRWVKFAKYLPRFGIDPVMLVPENPTYPIRDASLKNEVADNLPVYTSKSFEPFSLYRLFFSKDDPEFSNPATSLEKHDHWKSRLFSWIRGNIFIPDARAGWLLTARKKALEIIETYSIETVITTGPPHSAHFIGKYLKEQRGLRWIADFRDPWTEIYYNQILPKTNVAQAIDLKLEKSVLRNADKVIVISPSMIPQQQKIVDRNYELITNGFDPDDFPAMKNTASKDSAFIIRHIGTLSEAAIPESLFQAMTLLPVNLDYRVEFIGNVHREVRNQARIRGLQPKVSFRDYMPHPQAVSQMMRADMLLLIIPKVEDNELILTGKLFEYLATQKPVLMIGPKKGDAANVIQELDQGWCFDYEEIGKLASFLNRQISKSEPELDSEQPDRPARNLADHPYSRVKLTKQLADLING